MAYFVKSITSNGYRCSCCHRSHGEATVTVQSLADALATVPLKNVRDEYHELERIEVIDGPTGVVIAQGQLEFVGPRGVRYTHYRWFGHVDGDPFLDINGLRADESTWEDMVKRVHREDDEAKLKKLEAEAEAKRQEIEIIKARLQ